MTNNLDTLATALYAVTDDLLKESPQLAPLRPAVGISPQLSDAELVTLAALQAQLAGARLVLLRPARKGEPGPPGSPYFKPLRQVIESVNDTLKGQLDLERHGGRTVDGVTARILQRILALAAAIWHNDATGQPVMRSLTAYDH